MSDVTLVCFAVPQEARPFLKTGRERRNVRVTITGMGARNAERAIREMLQRFSPVQVITCGFAGALNPELQIADVLFDREKTPAHSASKLIVAGVRPVKFVCVQRVAVSVAEKTALRASSAADAVEMESGVIQRICAEAVVPCLTLRAISDLAAESLPFDFNALLTKNQKFSYLRLILAVMQRPSAISALARLGKNSTRAANELSRVLSNFLADATR